MEQPILSNSLAETIPTWGILFAVFFCGILLGLGLALILRWIHGRTARELAQEIYSTQEAQRMASMNEIIEQLRASFGTLSFQALSRSTDEFLKLAKSRFDAERDVHARELEAKKGLIDNELQRMSRALENVSMLMQTLEKDRVDKFSALATQMKVANEQTATLVYTTNQLRQALANTKARGQWGERMAEDVLRMAGFVENVNYLKQRQTDGTTTRPDFTFLLPRNLRLNMDVKFPLDNYLRFLDATTTPERQQYRNAFLRDVKARIREVTTRDYINPENQTVDYALLFIPNEQIYAFIHEQDSSLLDEGIRNRVVFCSPITLYAVLAVIRQAVDNFSLERTSNEILSLLGAFKKQWDQFIVKMDGLGKRITDAQREFETLVSTRRRQLEKPLDRIEALRTNRNLPPADSFDDELTEEN
ncbi:DNA recombination protein RmuC [candidate division KSB1 bacterium]|nr:DNA recombination protein RmuC [candidate division KSB1 bacterium]